MFRSLRVVSAALTVLLLSTFAGTAPAHAAGDTTAPQLVDFSFTPTSVDASSSAQTITVTAHITDTGTGLAQIGQFAYFTGPNGWTTYASFDPTTRSGSAQDGIYTSTMTVPKYAAQGTWTVSSIWLSDPAGNSHNYTADELTTAGFPTSFTQTGQITDTTAPQLVDFSFTPTSVDASSSAQTITVTAHITDTGTGLAQIGQFAYFTGPNGWTTYASFDPTTRSGSAQDGIYTSTMTVPKYAAQGTWTVSSIWLSDPAGNSHNYTADELTTAGFPTSFTQTGQITDTTAPQLVDFSFTPTSVDASSSAQTITVTAHITDTGTGLAQIGQFAYFTGPNGWTTYASFDPTTRSGSAQDGIYTSTMTVPKYAAQGTWTVSSIWLSDPAGNSHNYTADELTTAGFPTSFQVTTEGPVSVPTAPTGVSASPGDGSATVSWSAPADNGGAAITSYSVTVYSAATLVQTVTAAGSSTVVTGLTNGAAYTFKVAATNTAGTGAVSTASAAVTPRTMPGAPTGVSAATGNGQATVSWSAPADNGGAAITSNSVTVYSGSSLVQTVTATGTSTTVTGLANGTAYTFKVAATNSAGTGATSTASAAVTPMTVPAAPTSVSATAGNAQAVVSWSAPSDNGGSAITGYSVTAYSGSILVQTVTATGTSTTVTGLANGTAYTFKVAATNSAGTGATSTASGAVTPRTVPAAPTGVSASPGNAQLGVSWSAPVDNGGSAITSYTVSVYSGATLVKTVSATGTGTPITGLTNGTPYTFKVAATNTAGTGPQSAASTPVMPVGPPTAVQAVTATPGDGQATVSWALPASNGGIAVSGYTLNVLTGGITVRTLTVYDTATSTTISGLTNGTAYTFTVAARNTLGPGPDSAPSAAVTPSAPVNTAPPVDTTPAGPTGPTATLHRSGYWMVGSDGKVYAFGDAKSYGNAATSSAVDLEPTPSGNGYWIVDDLGRVFAFGDAVGRGNVDRARLAVGEKVTSLSATKFGNGYWVFTSRGRVLTFGDALFLGDVSNKALNGPVLDSIPTPTGNGYYMVASDGGIFAFGDADFYGSMGGKTLNAPVQSLVPDSDGVGYWLVASDGGIFAFQADFKGSMGATKLNKPVTGMVRAGSGYLMVGEDGGIFDFSGTPDGFKGSLGANPPAHPITSVAVLEDK